MILVPDHCLFLLNRSGGGVEDGEKTVQTLIRLLLGAILSTMFIRHFLNVITVVHLSAFILFDLVFWFELENLKDYRLNFLMPILSPITL